MTQTEEKVVKQFTEEERTQVLEAQNKVLATTARIGEIELEIQRLDTIFQQLKQEKQELIQNFENLRNSEIELSKTLTGKYGVGTYDINTNTFTPTE